MYRSFLYNIYYVFVSFPISLLWFFYCSFHNKKTYKTVEFYSYGTQFSLTFLDSNFFPIKYINIPLDILLNKVSLIGISFSDYRADFENSKLEVGLALPGMISLYDVRQLTKNLSKSREQVDAEQLKNSNFLSRITILFLFMWNSIFFKKSNFFTSNINLLGIKLLNSTKLSVINLLTDKKKKTFYFMNAHNYNQSFKYFKYRDILKSNSYNLVDGSGVNLACKMTKQHLRENLNGTDLFDNIATYCTDRGLNLYLLGATEASLRSTIDYVQKSYPGIKIKGGHSGYFSNSKTIIEEINKHNIDILFVAMGTPYQELWTNQHRAELDVTNIFCVGGLFDFLSAKRKRAPRFLRDCGLEWCYRLYLEPRRLFHRYIIGNFLFLFRVIFYRS